jgi:hypothetical protein
MSTRREFIKKASYTVPVVMTMAAKPSFASTGSAPDEKKPKGKKKGKKKKGKKKKGKKKGKSKKKK